MFSKLFFDGTAAGGGTTAPATEPATTTPAATTPPADFDAYLASLPAEQRAHVEKLYNEKNQGLLNSVKATRGERDEFAAQLREAAKKLEKGSAAEKQLLDQANQLDEANRRASFMEDALTHECKNPKAAYAIAKTQDLFNKAGVPDWKSIQEAAPELFGAVTPKPKGKGGAGAGTGGKPAGGGTMNDLIRAAAGHRVDAGE